MPLRQILLSSIHLINSPRYLLLGVSIYVSAASRQQKFPLPSSHAIKIDFSNSLFTKNEWLTQGVTVGNDVPKAKNKMKLVKIRTTLAKKIIYI